MARRMTAIWPSSMVGCLKSCWKGLSYGCICHRWNNLAGKGTKNGIRISLNDLWRNNHLTHEIIVLRMRCEYFTRSILCKFGPDSTKCRCFWPQHRIIERRKMRSEQRNILPTNTILIWWTSINTIQHKICRSERLVITDFRTQLSN